MLVSSIVYRITKSQSPSPVVAFDPSVVVKVNAVLDARGISAFEFLPIAEFSEAVALHVPVDICHLVLDVLTINIGLAVKL